MPFTALLPDSVPLAPPCSGLPVSATVPPPAAAAVPASPAWVDPSADWRDLSQAAVRLSAANATAQPPPNDFSRMSCSFGRPGPRPGCQSRKAAPGSGGGARARSARGEPLPGFDDAAFGQGGEQ